MCWFQSLHTYCFKHEKYASFKILEIDLSLRGGICKKPEKLGHLKHFRFITSLTFNTAALNQPKSTCSVFLSIFTNTKSLSKEFSKILIFEYFRYLKMEMEVFLTLIPNHPTWRRVKMQSWALGSGELWAKNWFLCGHVTSARLNRNGEKGFISQLG